MNFGTTSLIGVLLGIFIYWGWDSGVAVNEESEDPAEGPGRAAVVSTLLLVAIYLSSPPPRSPSTAPASSPTKQLRRHPQRARHGRARRRGSTSS